MQVGTDRTDGKEDADDGRETEELVQHTYSSTGSGNYSTRELPPATRRNYLNYIDFYLDSACDPHANRE